MVKNQLKALFVEAVVFALSQLVYTVKYLFNRSSDKRASQECSNKSFQLVYDRSIDLLNPLPRVGRYLLLYSPFRDKARDPAPDADEWPVFVPECLFTRYSTDDHKSSPTKRK